MPDDAPILEVSESLIDLGEIDPGDFVEPERIDVTNAGGGTLEWSVACEARWVSIEVDEDGMTVRLRPRLGSNRAEIVVRDGGGATKTIRLKVDVRPPPTRPVRTSPGPVLRPPAVRRPAPPPPTVAVLATAPAPPAAYRPTPPTPPRKPTQSRQPRQPRQPGRPVWAVLTGIVVLALVVGAVLVGTGAIPAPWDRDDDVTGASPSTSPSTTVAALPTAAPAAPVAPPSTAPRPTTTTAAVRVAAVDSPPGSACLPLTVQVAAQPKSGADAEAFRAEAARLIGSVPTAGPLHYGDGTSCGARTYSIYYVGPFASADATRAVCLAIGAELASHPSAYGHFRTGDAIHWPFYRDQRDRVRTPDGGLFFCRPGAG